ncbi:MAG: hypothetical protein ACAH11_04290 [Sphingomonas sp.]
MKIYDKTKKELMQVSKIERDGNALVLKGKIFGTMPMTALLTPEEARAALKLLDVKTVFFLLTILFRKSSKG